MQHFHRDGQDYWGGLHRELGLLIYDPRDQQRLAADKVRLYVVAERRLATFVKERVRAGLVPSRLDTWWCPQHAVVMQPWHNAQGTNLAKTSFPPVRKYPTVFRTRASS